MQEKCQEFYKKNCNEMGIKTIRFDGKKGIIRCNHIAKENTIKLLNSIEKISSTKVKILTTGTSGTIKRLTKKYL